MNPLYHVKKHGPKLLQPLYFYCWLFWGIFLALAVLDVVMVTILQVESISARTWDACNAHPTIQVAGCIATFIVVALVRRLWWSAAMAGAIGAHLFTHF